MTRMLVKNVKNTLKSTRVLFNGGSNAFLPLRSTNSKTIHVIFCFIIWVAPQAGKMKRLLCSDWLPERARWAYLASSGFPALFPQTRNSLVYSFGHIINPLLTKLVLSRWLDIGQVPFLRFYGPRRTLGP